MESVDGISPSVAVDEVVPFRNQVSKRAAVVAEGNAAVHATCSLILELLPLNLKVNLLPVSDAFWDGAPARRDTLNLKKSFGVTHYASLIFGVISLAFMPLCVGSLASLALSLFHSEPDDSRAASP